MPLDFKKLLENHLNRTAGKLKFPLADAEPARGGGPRSSDHESQELDASSEDALLPGGRWNQFFSNLLSRGGLPEADRSTTNGNHGQPPSADDEDMTRMFAGSAVVQALKAQLDRLPDIRQQRVDSLKRALAMGKYQIYPQRIATAMLADEELDLY